MDYVLRNLFFRAHQSKLVWADRSFSDCLAVLNAFSTWDKFKREGRFERVEPGIHKRNLEQEWCYGSFLELKVLEDVKKSRDEIINSLTRVDIQKFPTPNIEPLIWDEKLKFVQIAIFGAFYPNYFLRKYGGHDMQQVINLITWRMFSKLKFQVHKTLNGKDPMTSVYLTGFPSEQCQFGELYVNEIKEIFAVRKCQFINFLQLNVLFR